MALKLFTNLPHNPIRIHDNGKKIHHLYYPQPINNKNGVSLLEVEATNTNEAIDIACNRYGLRGTIVMIRYRLKHDDCAETMDYIFARNENDAKSNARKAYYKKTNTYLSTNVDFTVEEAHDFVVNGETVSEVDLENLFGGIDW